MCLAENQATPDKIMSACMGGGHHDDHDGPQCSMADGMVMQGVENADEATQMAAMAKLTKSCSACVMAKGTSGGDVEDCFDPSAMQAASCAEVEQAGEEAPAHGVWWSEGATEDAGEVVMKGTKSPGKGKWCPCMEIPKEWVGTEEGVADSSGMFMPEGTKMKDMITVAKGEKAPSAGLFCAKAATLYAGPEPEPEDEPEPEPKDDHDGHDHGKDDHSDHDKPATKGAATTVPTTAAAPSAQSTTTLTTDGAVSLGVSALLLVLMCAIQLSM